MANTKLSQIASGGAVAGATDVVVAVRSGTTDLLVTPVALDTAQTWTAKQTFTNSDIALLGSSTGATTFVSDNAGASNYNMHVPAANDTLTAIAAVQTLTNKTLTDPVMTQSSRVTTQTDVTSSTALTAITGLTAALTAGAKYAIDVYLPITAAATPGAKFALGTSNTLTATSFSCTGSFDSNGTLGAKSTTTTLGTAVASAAAAGTSAALKATIVVNAAGTLICEIAQNTSNGTPTSALVNGYMVVTRLNN